MQSSLNRLGEVLFVSEADRRYAFNECSKLVPSDIYVSDFNAVVAYLRSTQNSTPNMSMFWSIAVVLFALIAQFAFMNK
ncbi:hypothetical protein TrST_g2053 [Triparma strigata]|uniref:Uncharacterized protein n=1 Tax=Triparma strigata TaxID=1606541 RepID=A0A9W7ACE1_9STRA|nr:hypothetical protein TrST_g2053 [Triparma strigata]